MTVRLLKEDEALERQYEVLYRAFLELKDENLRLKKIIRCQKKQKN